MIKTTQEEIFNGAKSIIDGIGVKGLTVREMTPGELKLEMDATVGVYIVDTYTGLDVRIHDGDIITSKTFPSSSRAKVIIKVEKKSLEDLLQAMM